ncbi:MAG: hypothetical protein ACXAB2_04650 [Candidatus Hodarchaeales archaeon]|jgi:ubiquinone/menaquinone biosynthesis C-methylase UbiE
MKAIVKNLIDKEDVSYINTCFARRTLILMSFRDNNLQSLFFIMRTVGIRNLKDQEDCLQEIFRFIQKGILYIPNGFLPLIEMRDTFFYDSNKTKKIKVYILRPLKSLLEELEKEFLE